MSGDGTHGTLFKTGPFSDEEDMQLRAILRDELEKRSVEWNDANLLLVLSGNKSINGLWVSVARRYPLRTKHSIYEHCRERFWPTSARSWTAAERAQLLEMRMVNKPWSAIALALNRTPTSCRDMGRQLRTPNARTGEWTPEEVTHLRDLYDELNGTARNGGTPWDAIAQRLGSRTRDQVRVKWRSLECTRSLGEWADHDDVAVLKYIVEIKSPSSETLRFAKLTAATGWANVQLRGKLTQLRNKYRSREIELLWMWAQRTLDQILGGTAVGNVAAAADGAELDGDAVPPPPPPLTSSTPLSGRRRHQSRRITSAGRRPYGRSGSEGDEGDDDAADNERDGADVVEEFGDADRVEENEFDIDDDGDDEDESRDAGGREISADEEYREGDEDGSGSAEHGATKLRNMSRHQTATKRRFADLDQQLSTPMIAAKHMRTGAVNVAGGASSTGAAVLIAHQNQLKPLEVPSNMPTLLVTATPGASRVAAAMAVAAAATSTASTTSMSGTVPLLPPPARKLAAAVADSGAAAEADDLRMPPASLLPSLLAIPIPFTAAAVAAAAAADGVRSGAQQNPALQLPGIASLLSARLPMPRAPSVPTFQS